MSKKFNWVGSYASAPPFAFLLDDYGNAYYANSVARRLSSSYTGALIRIRRSNDNAEQDIGYGSNNELDTAAITSFVGSNSAYIKTKYDQTGNGRHFTQATAANQPLIVNAGTLEVRGGKPAALYDTTDAMGVVSLTSKPTNAYLFTVFELTKNIALIHNATGTGSASGYINYFVNGDAGVPNQNSGTITYFKNGSALSATRDALYDGFINQQGLLSHVGVDIQSSGSWALNSLYDSYGGGGPFSGWIQEDVMYNDTSNSRTGIEDNIKTFYGL